MCGVVPMAFAERFTKFVGFLMALGTVITMTYSGWLFVWGGGIVPKLKQEMGITEVLRRLDDLENYMPPPPVVRWNEVSSKQVGNCSFARCSFQLTAARTEYGNLCGGIDKFKAWIVPQVGANIEVSYRDFVPVHLSIVETTFFVDIKVPREIRSGKYSWYSEVEYANCPGAREPRTRYSPVFHLDVNQG